MGHVWKLEVCIQHRLTDLSNQVFNYYVLLVLAYGAETLTLTKKRAKKIKTVQRTGIDP